MHLTGRDAKDLPRLADHPSKQFRRVVRVQPIQCAPQTVVIEHLGLDPHTQQVFNRLFAKYCGTRYSCRRLHPKPFRIIATVAVPALTCWRLPGPWASSQAARPISWHTPATIPRWSSRSFIYLSVGVIVSPPFQWTPHYQFSRKLSIKLRSVGLYVELFKLGAIAIVRRRVAERVFCLDIPCKKLWDPRRALSV
jgi:hypothetical protein